LEHGNTRKDAESAEGVRVFRVFRGSKQRSLRWRVGSEMNAGPFVYFVYFVVPYFAAAARCFSIARHFATLA
jgi:hypothetical protein